MHTNISNKIPQPLHDKFSGFTYPVHNSIRTSNFVGTKQTSTVHLIWQEITVSTSQLQATLWHRLQLPFPNFPSVKFWGFVLTLWKQNPEYLITVIQTVSSRQEVKNRNLYLHMVLKLTWNASVWGGGCLSKKKKCNGGLHVYYYFK